MSKHTPGPWEAGIKQSHGTEVRGPKGVSIAWCGQAMITGIHGSHSIRSAEANANARPIAAAPELLEALQKFVAWSDAEGNHEGATFWQRIEMLRELDDAAAAAIAKVEGGAA